MENSNAPVGLLAALESVTADVVARRLLDLRSAAEAHTSIETRWLQGDLYDALSRGGLSVHQQVLVPCDGQAKIVDLVLSGEEARLLVELKSFPTAYGCQGLNVTQRREAILRDLAELGRRVSPGADGYALWALPQHVAPPSSPDI